MRPYDALAIGDGYFRGDDMFGFFVSDPHMGSTKIAERDCEWLNVVC